MNGGGPRGPGSLSATQAEEMDRACDRFEGEWRAGARPNLAAYLAGPSGPVRGALVRELIAVDLAWRERAGERPLAEDYLQPFPSDADAVLAAFETVGRPLSASPVPDAGPATARRSAAGTDPRPDIPFERVVSLCEGFTGEWGPSGRPSIPSYLARVADDARGTLLRNLLQYEIVRRRSEGECPRAEEYILHLPRFAALVRQVFLESSFSFAKTPTGKEPPDAAFSRRLAANRLGDYRLVRELGRGGMGMVFEAIHVTRGNRVALKALPAVDGNSLHRFKREFRALADITHPNLVGLRTLESDGAQWFITLDLLSGCNFLAYVRPDNRLDEGRLRSALAQVAAGVMALHARDIVHRDLKPGNVMVTTGGRVVILDFGLVAELGRAGVLSADGGIAGTPAYMAPEQAAGQATGPPADWYALGIMAYEALTGVRPFDGDPWQVMRDKQARDAPRLTAALGLPGDLADLTNRLISREPASRPDPLGIAGVLATSTVRAVGSPGTAGHLVGRASQLAALDDALATLTRSQEPVTVFVQGRSGEGKTSLVEAFLDPLRQDPSVVILAGRCYDRESVPFKALDALIDVLTTYLRSLPEAEAALLLPDDIGLLAEVFPVLQRCGVVARAPRGRLDALDQQQIRQRAFAALRLLLDRVAGRTSLVCFIDDLQWGDADSAAAIFEVLRPPASPALLFVGSYRSDEADSSPFLAEWSSLLRRNGVDFGDRVVTVGPLSLQEATQLVASVVGRGDEVVERRAVQFHAESGGNPFLLVELAGCFDPDSDAFRVTDIHGVLAQKLGQMPVGSGALLDAVSVSGQAVALGEAAAAAGIAEPEGTLNQLRTARLLRVVGAKVDTYHDRIRYAVLDQMPDTPRRDMHRRLAEVIEGVAGGIPRQELEAIADGKAEPGGRAARARVDDLYYHFDAAGDQRHALAYALVAATQARNQYALDFAAQQYAVAERNAEGTPDDVRFHIARGRGEALLQLGRYEDARPELRHAADLSHRLYDKADVQGLLGELAYKLGGTAESIHCYEGAIQKLGIKVPRSPSRLFWELARESAVQLAHRLFPGRLHRGSPDSSADLANRLLARLEYAYYCNNAIKLLWASLVGLNGAERLPPSPALAFNYVVHANDMGVFGWHSRASRFYRAAIDLSRELNDEWGAAQSLNHFAMGELQAGRYESAIAKAAPGKAIFTKLGDLYETHLAHLTTAYSQYGLGNLAAAVEEARWIFESAVRNGDNAFASIGAPAVGEGFPGNAPIRRADGLHSSGIREQSLQFGCIPRRGPLASASRAHGRGGRRVRESVGHLPTQRVHHVPQFVRARRACDGTPPTCRRAAPAGTE